MSASDLQKPGVRFSESPLESSRFGLPVARLIIGSPDDDAAPQWAAVLEEIRTLVSQSKAHTIIARWPARASAVGGVLAETDRRVIPADNLVYWEIPAEDLAASVRARTADQQLRVSAGDITEDELADLIADSFADYPSHYAANPALDDALALEGYCEWAQSTWQHDRDLVLALRDGPIAIGAATCATGEGELEVLLAGLRRASQGGGRYAVLLQGAGELAMRRGLARVVISTQAGNVNVQRVWARAGFVPFATFATAHLVKARQ